MKVGSEAVVVDEARWPIVVVTLRGHLSDDDYNKLFESVERIMARREQYVMVTDLRELQGVASAKQRQDIADKTDQLERKYGPEMVGSVKVVKSALVRGALTAFQWIRGNERGDTWVGTMDAALEIALRMCRDSGITVADDGGRQMVE